MNVLTFIGGAVVSTITMVIRCVLNGWVLTKLWGWFLVSTFEFPVLSLAPAIGISAMIAFLTRSRFQPDQEKKKISKIFIETTMFSLLSSGTALLIGWVAHSFM